MTLSHESPATGDWLNTIERLICWIAPRTVGRARVIDRLADVKAARFDCGRLIHALCLLARDLETLHPSGAVITLVRRRVRDGVMALEHQRAVNRSAA